MTQLANKKIVIIGGTTGLGLSAAKAFITNGASVVVVGRNEESAEKAKADLGTNAIAISADATYASTAVNAIEACIKSFGDFDGRHAGDDLQAFDYIGHYFVFDAGVEVFGVFAEDDQIDRQIGKARLQAGQHAHGAEVYVQI